MRQYIRLRPGKATHTREAIEGSIHIDYSEDALLGVEFISVPADVARLVDVLEVLHREMWSSLRTDRDFDTQQAGRCMLELLNEFEKAFTGTEGSGADRLRKLTADFRANWPMFDLEELANKQSKGAIRLLTPEDARRELAARHRA